MKSHIILYLRALFAIAVTVTVYSQYDQMVNLFDPNGELLQVKYAEKASSKGNPLICFISENVLCLVCRSPPYDNLFDHTTIDKVEKVDDEIWASYCGLAGDGKALIRSSRSFSVGFRKQFGFPPPVVAMAKHIGDAQHEATLKGDRRPLGVKLVYLGYDGNRPVLYSTGPSGLVSEWKAVAIGDHSDKLMRVLEDSYMSDMKQSVEKGALVAWEALQNINLPNDSYSEVNNIDDNDDNDTKKSNLNNENKQTSTKTTDTLIDISNNDNTNNKLCDIYLLRKTKLKSKNIQQTSVDNYDDINNDNTSNDKVEIYYKKGIKSTSEIKQFFAKYLT